MTDGIFGISKDPLSVREVEGLKEDVKSKYDKLIDILPAECVLCESVTIPDLKVMTVMIDLTVFPLCHAGINRYPA